MMSVKQELYNSCQSILEERLKRIQKTISDIEISLNAETKSTAGDKHETGRAMLQLEREKAGSQLKEIQQQQRILNRIQPETTMRRAALGSVIKTTVANYFIAVSAGEIKIQGETFYAISFDSPIGQLLKGTTEGEQFSFRGKTIKIIKIL